MTTMRSLIERLERLMDGSLCESDVADKFVRGDYVSVTVDGLSFSQVVTGYFVRDAGGNFGVVVVKQGGEWNIITGYNLRSAGHGEARERQQALAMADKKTTNMKRKFVKKQQQMSDAEKRAEQRDWLTLRDAVLEYAKRLAPYKDVVTGARKRSFTGLAGRLGVAWGDLNKKRRPLEDWETIVRNLGMEVDEWIAGVQRDHRTVD